jgi:threonine dehydratase
VAELLARCPAHAPTPLAERTGLAGHADVARLFLKDERSRMGLGSFKALGAAYAMAREAAAEDGGTLLSDSSWPGYTELPWRVMEGYLQLAAKTAEQIGASPAHILLQAGVGGSPQLWWRMPAQSGEMNRPSWLSNPGRRPR